jgi:hypothetical protein
MYTLLLFAALIGWSFNEALSSLFKTLAISRCSLCNVCRLIAQAFRRRSLTAEAPCETCGAHSGTGTGVSPSISASPVRIIPPTVRIHLQIYTALTRRKNGRGLTAFKHSGAVQDVWQHLSEQRFSLSVKVLRANVRLQGAEWLGTAQTPVGARCQEDHESAKCGVPGILDCGDQIDTSGAAWRQQRCSA